MNKNYTISNHIKDNSNFDAFVISVGTPLDSDKVPILDFVKEAASLVGSKIKKDNLIILRSTVPVGTSRNTVIPILEKESNMKNEIDFQVVFAPERTAEGVAIKELRTNPQIIGGISEKGVNQASDIFKKITKSILTVSSIEAAEMIKLIDNTYRDIRFAYANEIAIICEMLKLNANECITKANQNYPRNSIPIPSPGVGGPCLSKDPHILMHVAKKFDFNAEVIGHSRELNEFVPKHLAIKLINKLKKLSKNTNSKIFIIGFAFKGNPETDDSRNSSTELLIKELKKEFPNIYGYDPVVKKSEIMKMGAKSVSIEEGFENADCVIVMNNHKSYLQLDIDHLLNKSNLPVIFADCWSMFKKSYDKKRILYTGIGIE